MCVWSSPGPPCRTITGKPSPTSWTKSETPSESSTCTRKAYVGARVNLREGRLVSCSSPCLRLLQMTTTSLRRCRSRAPADGSRVGGARFRKCLPRLAIGRAPSRSSTRTATASRTSSAPTSIRACPSSWDAGDGSLGRYVFTPLAGQHPDLASADFNGDGIPDYVVGELRGQRSAFSSETTAAVGRDSRLPTGAATISVLAGDFNRDGKVDVAGMSSRAGRRDRPARQRGRDLRLNGALSRRRRPVGGATADLNRDGNLDILATTGLPDELRVLFGTGSGSFVGRRGSSGGRPADRDRDR